MSLHRQLLLERIQVLEEVIQRFSSGVTLEQVQQISEANRINLDLSLERIEELRAYFSLLYGEPVN
ncbi:hypothetical protein GCM10027085_63500 [Spirosoma aerophilum]